MVIVGVRGSSQRSLWAFIPEDNTHFFRVILPQCAFAVIRYCSLSAVSINDAISP